MVATFDGLAARAIHWANTVVRADPDADWREEYELALWVEQLIASRS